MSSVRCPCPCGAGASGWPARRCFLEGEGEKGKWCFTGFISPPNAPFGVLYNCLVMRFRCVRPARANGVQVLPLCFQGDADEVSGHASHSPPLSVVLFLWARGEIRGGWGENPDRPAKADQIRESPSALALAVPARFLRRSGSPGAPGTNG